MRKLRSQTEAGGGNLHLQNGNGSPQRKGRRYFGKVATVLISGVAGFALACGVKSCCDGKGEKTDCSPTAKVSKVKRGDGLCVADEVDKKSPNYSPEDCDPVSIIKQKRRCGDENFDKGITVVNTRVVLVSPTGKEKMKYMDVHDSVRYTEVKPGAVVLHIPPNKDEDTGRKVTIKLKDGESYRYLDKDGKLHVVYACKKDYDRYIESKKNPCVAVISKAKECVRKVKERLCRRRTGSLSVSIRVPKNGKVYANGSKICKVENKAKKTCKGSTVLECGQPPPPECKEPSLSRVRRNIQRLKNILCRGKSGSQTFSFKVKSNGNVEGNTAFSQVSLGPSNPPWCERSGSVVVKCGEPPPECKEPSLSRVRRCIQRLKNVLCRGKSGSQTFSFKVKSDGKVGGNAAFSQCSIGSTNPSWCERSGSVSLECSVSIGRCSAKVKRLAKAEIIRHVTFKYRGKIKGILQRLGKRSVTIYYKVSGSGSVRITGTNIPAVTREIKLRRAGRITPPEGGKPCKGSLVYTP